jgi:polyhydroxyalkanoate synthase
VFLQLLLHHRGTDAAFVRRVLAGLNAYRVAQRPPRPPAMPEIARVGRARLLDYGGAGRPVLFVPSLINPPYVLDLAAHNSMLRWLAQQGIRTLLLDWGDPREGGETLSVGGHVEALLLPLIAALGETPMLAGYCLGGTMTIAAAALAETAGVITIAAPWRFDGFPDAARADLAKLWQTYRAPAETLGLFPMEFLQTAFWQLDPERTLAKYADFGALAPDSPEAVGFVTLEDWANDGPPLTVTAARELLEDMFSANLPGTGAWRVGGAIVDPAALRCPLLNIVSTRDRIVPAASAPEAGESILLDQGHVGMVTGRRAMSGLWTILARWISDRAG